MREALAEWCWFLLGLCALALCTITPRAEAAIVAHALAQDGSVVLTDEPCPLQVLWHLPQGTRGYFRRASVLFDSRIYVACWSASVLKGVRMIYIKYEDGDEQLIPAVEFESDKEL